MSQCRIEGAEGLCECDNCGHECDASKLDMVSDIEQRLDAGGVVPAGQCPECGALSYLKKEAELPTGMHVVVAGNLHTGFKVFGPFKTEEDADKWADSHRETYAANYADFYVMPLEAPSSRKPGR